MLKKFQISGGRIVASEEEQSVIHLYITPDDQERKHLTGNLHIDEHTLLSALDPNELARMEFEPDHTAIIIKRPKRYSALDNFLFKVESIGLFVFNERLVIVISVRRQTVHADRLDKGRYFAVDLSLDFSFRRARESDQHVQRGTRGRDQQGDRKPPADLHVYPRKESRLLSQGDQLERTRYR